MSNGLFSSFFITINRKAKKYFSFYLKSTVNSKFQNMGVNI